MTTQRVSASYQEIIDLHTETDRVSVLGFHTPANDEPIRLLKPFWEAYQKVKYLGCSMSLVPAARLPADPSQVSYGAGEPPIDPRDLLNPILFKGCHGNDMGAILNQFYAGDTGIQTDIDRLFSDSMDHNMVNINRVGNTYLMEGLYYRALTDNTWLKAHPQRGFRKTMRPMVYRVAVNTPLNPNQSTGRNGTVVQAQLSGDIPDDGDRGTQYVGAVGPATSSNTSSLVTTGMPGLQQTTSSGTGANLTVTWTNPESKTGQMWMTPGIRPLGWIDTRQPSTGAGNTNSYPVGATVPTEKEMFQQIMTNYIVDDARYCYIPKIYMGMCLLPRAYKTEQYFRIVLNHHFAFAKYRGTSMRTPGEYGASNVVDMNDIESSSKVIPDGSDDKGILDD